MVGTYTLRDGNMSGASGPFTSRKTPTTVNERDGIGGAPRGPDASRRTDCPTASPAGQSRARWCW